MGVAERRERERAHRKNRILGAARTLLFSRGLEGTTVSRIAKLAEVSVATIYSYYENREEIIVDLSEEGFDLISFAIAEAVSGHGSAEERLHRAAQAYLSFSVAHKEYFSVLNHFLTTPQTVLVTSRRKKVHRHGEKILQVVESVVRDGIDQGRFCCHDPRRFALMFWGCLNGIVHMKKFRGTLLAQHQHKALYRDTVTCLVNGLKKQDTA